MHLESGKPDDALKEAELAIESATPLGQRDLLFQAHYLAAGILVNREQTEAALDHFTVALTLLEEMLQNLDESAGNHLLIRKETAAFTDDAKRLFQENNRSSEQERLRTLLQQ